MTEPNDWYLSTHGAPVPPPAGALELIRQGLIPRGFCPPEDRCLCGHREPAHSGGPCSAKGCRKAGPLACGLFRQDPRFLLPFPKDGKAIVGEVAEPVPC